MDFSVTVSGLNKKRDPSNKMKKFLEVEAPELKNLPDDRYSIPNSKHFEPWEKVGIYLAPNYIPRHQAMLDAVHQIEAK